MYSGYNSDNLNYDEDNFCENTLNTYVSHTSNPYYNRYTKLPAEMPADKTLISFSLMWPFLFHWNLFFQRKHS